MRQLRDTTTGWSKINGVKFSDACSVRANWLWKAGHFAWQKWGGNFKLTKKEQDCNAIYGHFLDLLFSSTPQMMWCVTNTPTPHDKQRQHGIIKMSVKGHYEVACTYDNGWFFGILASLPLSVPNSRNLPSLVRFCATPSLPSVQTSYVHHPLGKLSFCNVLITLSPFYLSWGRMNQTDH